MSRSRRRLLEGRTRRVSLDKETRSTNGTSTQSDVSTVSTADTSDDSQSDAEELSQTRRWAAVLAEVKACWYDELDKSTYYRQLKAFERLLPGAADLLSFVRLYGPSWRPILAVFEAYFEVGVDSRLELLALG